MVSGHHKLHESGVPQSPHNKLPDIPAAKPAHEPVHIDGDVAGPQPNQREHWATPRQQQQAEHQHQLGGQFD